MALPEEPLEGIPPDARIDNVEIYIDPDGSVVFADLPLELMFLYESLQQPASEPPSGSHTRDHDADPPAQAA